MWNKICGHPGRPDSTAPPGQAWRFLTAVAAFSVVIFLGGDTRPAAPTNASPAANLDEVQGLLTDGRFTDAEVAARDLLARVEGARGADSIEAAGVLDVLVEALWRGGKTEDPESQRLAERAVAIREQVLGPDHPDIARSLNNLGIVLSDKGDYAGARSAYERALAIRERHLGPGHPDVGRSLNNLGLVFLQEGSYAEAQSCFERSLAITETVLGPEHADVAPALINLGSLLGEIGDYARARPLYDRAVAIREKALGPGHPYVAMSLNTLAELLRTTGDYGSARPLYERALAILDEALPAEHPARATVLRGFGNLLEATGEVAEARRMYERVIGIRQKTHGAEHPHVAEGLSDLADLLRRTGGYEQARALYDRALAIWGKALGPAHASAARGLEGLAAVLQATGDRTGALALHERALVIREQALGGQHPDVARSLYEIADLVLDERRSAQAFAAALRAEEVSRRHVRLTARALSEREALRYAAVRTRGLDIVLSLAAQGLDGAGRRSAWEALIHSRAVVLDEMARRLRDIGQTADAEVARLVDRDRSARTRLAALIVRGPRDSAPAQFRRLLDGARSESERAERDLAGKSVVFAEDEARNQIGFADVLSALPPESALVSFVRYLRHRPPAGTGDSSAPTHGSPEAHYLAFILAAGDTEPRAVDLGKADRIAELVRLWRLEITSVRDGPGRAGLPAERRYRRVAETLRQAIWDPVSLFLRSARLVFVVPDGALSIVSLATLPSPGGSYLLETGPLLHYLSAERDLVPRGAHSGPRRGLLAVGGPDFDRRPSSRPFRAAMTGAQDATGPPPASHRSPGTGCRDLRDLRFAPLPGARAEAKMVASLWGAREPSSAGEGGVTVLVGAEASEARFKADAPGRTLLHLATHGFFVGERCPSAAEDSSTRALPPPSSVSPTPDDNPLFLSGLALAGANSRAPASIGGTGEEDGILTAAEIASLNLSGAQWVVLSACGTGLGELRAGEGVLGLRRAFQMAGVGTVIMSLWDVDDVSARRWVRALYQGRLKGLSTIDAVHRASLEMLQARRSAGISTHPSFWGVFIAAGRWE